MPAFVHGIIIASALTIRINGLLPGWKPTVHLMRGDEVAAVGMTFPDAGEDDRVVVYLTNKKETLAVFGSPRDVQADGALTLDFPSKAALQGEVRFVEGAALEGLVGYAGREPPFEGDSAKQAFMTLGMSRFKIENGHINATVPERVPGEVRFAGGCIIEKFPAAAHPAISITLPVGILEARIEDEKGKPVKLFTATAAGVALGGKAGHFKHAVLAGCDQQLDISGKGFASQSLPFRVERGGTVKLPTIVLRRR